MTLKGLDVKDRDGTSPFLSFESLYVNAEALSVFRGGPVLRAITLVRPAVSLVRNLDGTYSVQDLIEEFSKPGPKPKDGGPLRFSLNNIRVEGGRVDFDDRPKKTKHEVRDVRIGIPFLSNIPSKVEITTEPVLEAKVNGAPFALHGRTKPFSETRETTLDVDLTDVDLPYYLAYVPRVVQATLTSARLDAKLVFTFVSLKMVNPLFSCRVRPRCEGRRRAGGRAAARVGTVRRGRRGHRRLRPVGEAPQPESDGSRGLGPPPHDGRA